MPSPRCLFNIGESDNLLFAVAGKDLQSNESLDTVMCFDIELVLKHCLLFSLFVTLPFTLLSFKVIINFRKVDNIASIKNIKYIYGVNLFLNRVLL